MAARGGVVPAGGDARPPLTARQERVLAFVRGHVERVGYPPTIRDIGAAFGIKSPNGVMSHLRALAAKGRLRLGGGRARAITLPGVAAGGWALPLLGLVAAGPAIEAEPTDERVDLRDLFGADGAYLLRVMGRGLEPLDIAAGDLLALRPVSAADSGRTVAAEAHGAVGLHTYFPARAGGGYALAPKPAGARVEGGAGVRVLGVLLGVIRKG